MFFCDFFGYVVRRKEDNKINRYGYGASGKISGVFCRCCRISGITAQHIMGVARINHSRKNNCHDGCGYGRTGQRCEFIRNKRYCTYVGAYLPGLRIYRLCCYKNIFKNFLLKFIPHIISPLFVWYYYINGGDTSGTEYLL